MYQFAVLHVLPRALVIDPSLANFVPGLQCCRNPRLVRALSNKSTWLYHVFLDAATKQNISINLKFSWDCIKQGYSFMAGYTLHATVNVMIILN